MGRLGLFLLGVVLIADGMISLITGDGRHSWGKFPVPSWSGWIFVPIGVIICIMALRAIRRGEGKPKPYTDEDAKRAEAELDRMYLRDHGEPPEKKKHEE